MELWSAKMDAASLVFWACSGKPEYFGAVGSDPCFAGSPKTQVRDVATGKAANVDCEMSLPCPFEPCPGFPESTFAVRVGDVCVPSFPRGGSALQAFDPVTQEVVWSIVADSLGGPIIQCGKIFMESAEAVARISEVDGHEVWRASFPGGSLQVVGVTRSRAIVYSKDGPRALDIDTGEQVWMGGSRERGTGFEDQVVTTQRLSNSECGVKRD
jgi:outer membrane protein assembly factor BamB